MTTPVGGVSGVGSIDYVIGTSRTREGSPVSRSSATQTAGIDLYTGLLIRLGLSNYLRNIGDLVNRLRPYPYQRKVNAWGPFYDIENNGYYWLIIEGPNFEAQRAQPSMPPFYYSREIDTIV